MTCIDLAQLEQVHTKASSKIKRLGRSVSQRRISPETEKPPLTMIDEKPTDGTNTSKRWSWSDECSFFLDRVSSDRFFEGFVHM